MNPILDLAAPANLDSALSGSTLLVVDDMADVRRAIARTVQRAGARVLEAADGAAALVMVQRDAPDLVLLDIDMPGLSGIEVCETLRQTATVPRLPVILVTGRDDEDRHVAGYAAGCDDFLAKPVVPAVLVARVACLLAKRAAECENQRLVALLSRYVTEPARDGQRDHEVTSLEGTILFSDLRGFTATSVEVDPGILFSALCQVQATQTGNVVAFGGYVDKFSGDGMLAVFTGEGHAGRACSAAAGIVAWARGFTGQSFWRPLPIGIGLDTGTFLRGDMGTDEHLELTVIGQTVNTASRLCGMAAPLEILATAAVREAAGGAHSFVGPRHDRIKGLPDEVGLWQVGS